MAAQPSSTANLIQARKFEDRYFALGLAVDYLMPKPVFARLPFGHWSRVLAGQVNRGHYFFVVIETKVLGFAGWALTSRANAEGWLRGEYNPGADATSGSCLVLNAWAAENKRIQRFMIDTLRSLDLDVEAVYGKREYADGRAKLLRMRNRRSVTANLSRPATPAGSTL